MNATIRSASQPLADLAYSSMVGERMFLQALLERNAQVKSLQTANEKLTQTLQERVYQVARLATEIVAQIDTIDGLQKQIAQLENIALLDPLTGLYNRRGAEHAFQGMLGQYRRREHHTTEPQSMVQAPRHQVSVLMIDLDGFKAVNDSFGHSVGDQVLIRVAGLLKTVFRTDDIIYRPGGDEFLAYLIGEKSDCAAVERAMTLTQSLSGDPFLKKYSIGASIGIAVGHFRSSDGGAEIIDAVVSLADQAMYEAKKQKGQSETPILVAREEASSPTAFGGLTD